jgi:hypothetical protein
MISRGFLVILGAVLLPSAATGQGILSRVQADKTPPSPPPMVQVSAPMQMQEEVVQVVQPKATPKVVGDQAILPVGFLVYSVGKAANGQGGWVGIKDIVIDSADGPSPENPHYVKLNNGVWTLTIASRRIRFEATPDDEMAPIISSLIRVRGLRNLAAEQP